MQRCPEEDLTNVRDWTGRPVMDAFKLVVIMCVIVNIIATHFKLALVYGKVL